MAIDAAIVDGYTRTPRAIGSEAAVQTLELRYLARRIAELDAQGPVLELGAGWDVEFHRSPFRDAGVDDFYSHDIEPYEHVNFVGDLCGRTNIPDELSRTTLVFNVLEHVPAPWLALDEAWRVTQDRGVLIGSIPLRTAIHRHPKDYWRVCPDGVAYLLRRFKTAHFALDGNVGLPANTLFAAVKEPGDWLEHNYDAVLRPEIIVTNDYTTTSGFKRRVLDLLRRRLGMTVEIWDGPWNERRMRELDYRSWTLADYST